MLARKWIVWKCFTDSNCICHETHHIFGQGLNIKSEESAAHECFSTRPILTFTDTLVCVFEMLPSRTWKIWNIWQVWLWLRILLSSACKKAKYNQYMHGLMEDLLRMYDSVGKNNKSIWDGTGFCLDFFSFPSMINSSSNYCRAKKYFGQYSFLQTLRHCGSTVQACR